MPASPPHAGDLIDEVNMVVLTRKSMEEMSAKLEALKPDTVVIVNPHGFRVSNAMSIATTEKAIADWAPDVKLDFDVDVPLAAAIADKAEEMSVPVVRYIYGASGGDSWYFPLAWGAVIPLHFMGHRFISNPKLVHISPMRTLPLALHYEFGCAIGRVIKGPFWYYLPVLVAGLFPWSGLAVPALFRIAPRESRTDRLLLAWLLLPLAFFSLAGSKLPGYILPCVPPLAILMGRAADRLITEGRTPDRLLSSRIVALVGLLLGALVAAAPAALFHVQEPLWRSGIPLGAWAVAVAFLFSRRIGGDPAILKMLGTFPRPNSYASGDGLNTATPSHQAR